MSERTGVVKEIPFPLSSLFLIVCKNKGLSLPNDDSLQMQKKISPLVSPIRGEIPPLLPREHSPRWKGFYVFNPPSTGSLLFKGALREVMTVPCPQLSFFVLTNRNVLTVFFFLFFPCASSKNFPSVGVVSPVGSSQKLFPFPPLRSRR